MRFNFRSLALISFCFQTTLFGSLSLGTTTVVSSASGGGNFLPQVDVDPTGNSISIWQKSFVSQIEATFFNANTSTYDAPIIVSSGSMPKIGMDQNGNGISAFITTSNQIAISRFVFASKSWTTPIVITSTGVNSSPQIAVNSIGNGVVIWQTFPSQIQISSFTGAALNPTTPIVLSTTGGNPQVAINSNGTGFAVWQDFSTGLVVSTMFIVN